MEQVKLKEELLSLIKDKALIKGQRQLSSGQTSDFYIDGKQITLDPQGIFVVGKLIFSIIQSLKVDAVGGPTLGADPISSAVALLSSQSGKPIKAFIVRKGAKAHGMQKVIEGPTLEEGDHVVMVEDVVTTGKSVLAAIQEVEKTKAKVIKVISLVDRKEGADKVLAPYNYSPIFDTADLGL